MKQTAVRPSPIFLGVIAIAIVGGVLTTLNSTAAIDAGTLLLVLGGWVITLCLHEFGHAIVAYRGGDYAVRGKGYLTLDPRRYTDPVLSLLLPLLFLAFGGIPLPGGAVWINHESLRSRRIRSLVSLAGPFTNLALGIVLTVSVRFAFPPTVDQLFFPSALGSALSYLALLQILAFVLNILPVPGMDGFGALEPWLSYEARRFASQVRPWAPFVLFALLIGVTPIRNAFFDITDYIYNAVGGNQDLASYGQFNFLFWRH